MKKLAGIVAATGLVIAVGLTLLAFCFVFAGFAEPLESASGEWLNHAGASCFALSRIGWVLALAGGAAFFALTLRPGEAAGPSDKSRAGNAASKPGSSQPPSMD